jgi:hypothetical protein
MPQPFDAGGFLGNGTASTTGIASHGLQGLKIIGYRELATNRLKSTTFFVACSVNEDT